MRDKWINTYNVCRRLTWDKYSVNFRDCYCDSSAISVISKSAWISRARQQQLVFLSGSSCLEILVMFLVCLQRSKTMKRVRNGRRRRRGPRGSEMGGVRKKGRVTWSWTTCWTVPWRTAPSSTTWRPSTCGTSSTWVRPGAREANENAPEVPDSCLVCDWLLLWVPGAKHFTFQDSFLFTLSTSLESEHMVKNLTGKVNCSSASFHWFECSVYCLAPSGLTFTLDLPFCGLTVCSTLHICKYCSLICSNTAVYKAFVVYYCFS